MNGFSTLRPILSRDLELQHPHLRGAQGLTAKSAHPPLLTTLMEKVYFSFAFSETLVYHKIRKHPQKVFRSAASLDIFGSYESDVQGSSNDDSGRPHRGRREQRPCDLCRMRKTRCLVKDSFPCEKCTKALRVCTFDQEPPPRRPQPPEERNASETGPTIPAPQGTTYDPQYLLLQTPGAVLAIPSPGAIPGEMMDFDFHWDIFPTQSTSQLTPNALNNIPDNFTFNSRSFPSRPPSHPSPCDVAQSPAALAGPSSLFQVPQTGHMNTNQDGQPNRARILLGATSDMDPFLRSFYAFDDSRRFQSSLRSSSCTITTQWGLLCRDPSPSHR